MGMKLADALVFLGTDDSGLKRGFDQAKTDTKSWAGGLSTIVQGALIGVGQTITNGIIGLAKGAMSTIGTSISDASDMSETVSKINTLFGDDSNDILKWSEKSATGMGLSKQAALDAVGSIGNMFMQLGAGKKDAAQSSQSMTQLAADIASFHNVAGGTPEVLEAMTSAFRGEYDSVQKFIPTINAANVEHEALAMTGKATAKELTALDKALATQAIFMRDAGAATGDFERTAGGLANQQRIAEAQMKNFSATMGEALTPVELTATTAFNNLGQIVFPMITNFVREHVVPGMITLGEKLGKISELLLSGDFKGAWEEVKKLFGGVIEYIQTNLPTWTEKVAEWGKVAWQWVIDAIPSTITKLGEWGAALFGWVIDNAPTWGVKLREFAGHTWSWLFEDVIPAVGSKLGEWGTALGDWIVANAPVWGSELGQFAFETWKWLSEGVIPTVSQKLGEWGSALWQWIADNAPEWATKLGIFALNSWEWLMGTVVPDVANKLGEWGAALWEWISTNAPVWATKLGAFAAKTWDWLIIDVIPKVGEKLSGWATALWEWITTNAPTWGTKLMEFAAKTWNWLTGTDGAISKVGAKLGEWAGALYRWVTDPVNLNAWGEKLGGWATVAWQWIVDAAKQVPTKLGEWWTVLRTWFDENKDDWSTKLSEWTTELWQWIEDAYPDTTTKLEGWWGEIKIELDKKQLLLGDYMTTWKEIIASLFGVETQNNTKQTWGEWWDSLWPSMQEADKKTQEMAKSWEITIVEWIGNAIPAAILAFGDYMREVISGRGKAKETQDAVDQMQKDLEEALSVALSNIGKALWTAGGEIAWGIIDGIRNGLTGEQHTQPTFRSLELLNNRIKQQMVDDFGIRSPSTVFRGYGINLLEGLINGINHLFSDVTRRIGDLAGAIQNGFGDTGKLLWQKGVSIAQGLIDGLSHMMYDVQRKAAELANTVASAVSGALGIKSPSTVFMKFGEQSGEGYIIGMQNKFQTVSQAVKGSIGNVVNGIGSSISHQTTNNLILQGSGYAPSDALSAVQLLNMHYRNA